MAATTVIVILLVFACHVAIVSGYDSNFSMRSEDEAVISSFLSGMEGEIPSRVYEIECNNFIYQCDGDGYVTAISLDFAGLKGPIAPELGDLYALTYLLLFGNYLNGSIPPILASLQTFTEI